ncbi:ATP-binding protein [Halomonas sp. 5021]|jgi:two-component system sensor histidine kinase KdpD|uniref:sensor histidine kinase n=1 Tax=Halomonas sp. 5021 TaxID=3082156 RepID=UPI002FC58F89
MSLMTPLIDRLPRFAQRWHWPTLREVATALITTIVALLVAWGLYAWMALANLSLIFLTAVLASAVMAGSSAALISAVLGFLTFNFCFTVPHFSLAVEEREQLITLLFFLLVALVVGKLAGDSRQRLLDLNAARLAEDRERLRSALLSSVSHDFRTPLASIIGATSSLRTLDAQLSQEDRFALLDSVLSESERLNRYIQNLLDMTRLGHGDLKIERDWIAFDDLVVSARKRLGSALGHCHFVQHWPDDLPLLHVHPALIEQALVNVLDNAARFSPPGGQIAIHAESPPGATQLIFSITDQGPGIPAELRERVFDMFVTGSDGDRGPHGSGLGLAICQAMLGAHGGRIRACDGPGGLGTCMEMSLPLPPPHQEPPHDD